MTGYDVLLRNGRIVDGSGAPAYAADVAVKDGKIAEIGQLNGAEAAREIDVGGRVIAPENPRAPSTAPPSARKSRALRWAKRSPPAPPR